MARLRSPRYPSYPVGDAVAYAQKIYDGDGMHPMDQEVAIKHLGYSSINGASATALAGLKQYGLAASAGKGMIRLTDLALDLLEPENDTGSRRALEEAAFSPPAFAAIRAKFPDRNPSRDNLRAYLVREDFTKAAVPAVVDAYLATCEYVANADETESYGNEEEADTSSDVEISPSTKGDAQPMQTPTHTAPPVAGKWSETIRLGDSRATIELPEDMSDDDFDDFVTWMDFVRSRVERRFRRSRQQGGDLDG